MFPDSDGGCVRCSTAKDKGEKKLFGYSFVHLMQEDGRTLPDGTHELIIHKVLESYCARTHAIISHLSTMIVVT